MSAVDAGPIFRLAKPLDHIGLDLIPRIGTRQQNMEALNNQYSGIYPYTTLE